MIDQDELRQIRRRLWEAEEGTTQEKVSARQNYARDVKALLGALEDSGMALAVGRINELEDENARLGARIEAAARKQEAEIAGHRPALQGRMRQPKFEWQDGKLAACGRDD